MTKEEKQPEKKSGWLDTIKTVLAALALVLIVGFIYLLITNAKEREEKIKAQNKVAELSSVVQEKENLFSRLSQQALSQEEMVEFLKHKNEELLDLIQERDESILSLTESVIKIRATRIIIRQEDGDNIDQNQEGERTRVSFNETLDPVRVSGFTLTNPAEAQIDVSYTRPMRLTTAVVQDESGAWRTYIESDWPGVEVEAVETRVDPYPLRVVRRNTISVGVFTGINPIAPSGQGSIYALYRLGDWHIGPGVGVFLSDEDSGVNFGVAALYEVF